MTKPSASATLQAIDEQAVVTVGVLDPGAAQIIELVLKGLVLGFSIAAPVGPIGVLCIRRTLAEGRASGFVSGLGAATADAIYGSIAAFGLAIISHLLLSQRVWLGLMGGAFLCYLGIKTLLSHPADQSAAANPARLPGVFASTLLLTLTNPMTILTFIALFAGLATPGGSGDLFMPAALVLGVFLGSALWWFLLSGAVSLGRRQVDARVLRWVNWISGIVIVGFGLGVFISLTR